jgi:Protein of unknown function (DUF2510)
MDMPPPGWYEDPVQTGTLLRWWDGTQWTVHTAPLVQAPNPTRHKEQRSQAHEPVAALAAPVLPDVGDFAAAPADDEVSLTEWFASIPDQQAVAWPGRGGENSTQVLDGTLLPAVAAATPAERGARNTGALARLGWRRSAPVTEENLPLVERTQYGGMLRRNRSRLMWMVALGTAVAMLITGVLVGVFGSSTAPHSKPAAATQHPAATHSATPSPSATNAPSTTATTGTPVADTASGLSYALLAAPWQPGCPERRRVRLVGR